MNLGSFEAIVRTGLDRAVTGYVSQIRYGTDMGIVEGRSAIPINFCGGARRQWRLRLLLTKSRKKIRMRLGDRSFGENFRAQGKEHSLIRLT